jgi:myosin heavy subunit
LTSLISPLPLLFFQVGITPAYQLEVIRVLASLLWIGNVNFKANQKDESQVANLPAVDTIGSMLGLSTMELEGK